MCTKRIILSSLVLLFSQFGETRADLVGRWQFDEGSGSIAHDTSGHENDGILFGAPAWVGGNFGGALEFHGDGDYADCGNDPSLNIGGSVTIAGWIRLTGPADDRKIAGNQGGAGGGYKLGVYGNRLEFEIRTAENAAVLNRSVAGGITLEPGVWHHVAGVYMQGERIRTYINGELDRELATTRILAPSTGSFKLGREPFAGAYFWRGAMDDVRVYDRALLPDEIRGLMAEPPVLTAHSPDPPDGVSGLLDLSPPILTWKPGEGAQSHNVYFGTTPDLGPAQLVATRQTVTMHFHVPGFQPGITYYWRIDEVRSDGSVIVGPIWTFTIGPRRIRPEEQLIRNYSPAGWQAQDVQWIGDRDPHNKIDDAIDRSDAPTFDVVINYKRSVQDADIDNLTKINPQGVVQRRLKYISSVAVGGSTKDNLIAIADSPDVAFIEQQYTFTPSLDVSVPTICVTPAPGGCPTTVPAAIDGKGINIAIFDTGVDNSGTHAHDAFAATLFIGGYDAVTQSLGDPDDDVGHGTHVASIALGQATANTSRGVAPSAGLIDVKVFDAATVSCSVPGNWTRIVDGLETLYDNRDVWNVNVVNMSIQYCDKSGVVASDGLDAFSQLVDLAESMGIVVVAAASNNGPSNTDLPTPAAATRAITVANMYDKGTVYWTDDSLTASSSRGPRASDGDADLIDELKPEVTAPGTQIWAARFNSQNLGTDKTGTSMAAPHVAGLAALIMQARPGINAASVKDLIISTAELPAGVPASNPAIDPIWNDGWGWGVVNASAAINLATQADLTFPSHPPAWSWLSPDISHTPLQVGQPATVTAKIRNKGPNPATGVRVHFGVHVFSAATPTFYDIGTAIVDIPVDAAGSVDVQIPWTPQVAGHQCLTAEIGYSPDLDYSNNKAQRNTEVAQSPVQFAVSNTLTEKPARIELVGTLERPAAGWTFRIEPKFVTLAAGDGPVQIEAELYPPANAPAGSRQTLHVAAILSSDSGPVELGGVSIEAVAPSK